MSVIEERLARTVRRKALLKKAMEVGEIDWIATERDDRSLNAWETEDSAYISVRVRVDRLALARYENTLRRKAKKKGGK